MLAVSRAFGDIEAKLARFQGKPNVVVATPSIRFVKIESCTDFLVLGCDGIWDVLSTERVAQVVWNTVHSDYVRGKSFHDVCGECADAVLRAALLQQSLDNVTVVFVAFKHFKRCVRVAQHFNTASAIQLIPLSTPALENTYSPSHALALSQTMNTNSHVLVALMCRSWRPVKVSPPYEKLKGVINAPVFQSSKDLSPSVTHPSPIPLSISISLLAPSQASGQASKSKQISRSKSRPKLKQKPKP